MNPTSNLITEHVLDLAPEPVEDLLHPHQGGALLAVFQPVESGRRDAQLARKSDVRNVTPPLAQEPGKLLVQVGTHANMLPDQKFRMRNICVDAVPDAEYEPVRVFEDQGLAAQNNNSRKA